MPALPNLWGLIDLAGPAAEPGVVTQEELAEVDRLMDLVARIRDARRDIAGRLMAGAAVEPGPLSARAWPVDFRQFTLGALERLLGPALARQVYDGVPRAPSYRLDVRPSPSGRGPRPRGLPLHRTP